ncbi:type I-E CRISPR-associated protein Cas6/Cse3/CasE [Mangrovactinospora gilvigrisea]|uniref:Type I-E CRISPR-associated protein Cas6/Cse3/CasE n=1 Tax=Mangrovactinospora gilvigrisea TaxID=1428644 RepID=A0A1J7BHU8_9ACTN|nr:type I-E CRISPR-associated protein Cas6/Cse3/CasE [Mangrovactinospora gilvigrisea]OIV38222.1 type I-E CRISPR-associated protein Cas6/Cse3/CasE [Mangrovactinospora gilvigrisea]
MYLTRFRFNTARAGARRLLTSPQAVHAAVMSAYHGLLPSSPGDASRVLWRLDRNARAEVMLFMVGTERPDLTHLVEQAGWPAAAASGTRGWQTYGYAPFLDRLTKGGVWAFRLTANPVHSIRNRDGAPLKRTAHVTARHQLGWLLERQERSGFRIAAKREDRRTLDSGDEYEAVVSDRRNLVFAKGGSGAERKGQVSLVTVTFDGRLEVTDPDALRHVLTRGLGKAKAYGCGLMTLAPAGR